MTNGSEHSTGRRSSELRSPSYFRNVVPLGADCMSQLPETSPSKATRQVTTPISIPALPSEKKQQRENSGGQSTFTLARNFQQ
mmetsp:Transcript_27013/g.58273  ORF Transcript_27013/g.58273 Transcript_27013/m.58273 type:complete len:83 (-) Transcript_27013:2286-2534(-)